MDFDGTITDEHHDSEEYFLIYTEFLADKLRRNLGELRSSLSKYIDVIRNNPRKYGWKNQNNIIAPATGSFFLLYHVAVFQMLTKGGTLPYSTSADQDQLEKLLGEAFQYAYARIPVTFRPGAGNFMRLAAEKFTCIIVTNSHTDAVNRKLQQLPGRNLHGIRVIGNARKNIIEPGFEELPKTYKPKGFPRPVLLRRKYYYQILHAIQPSVVMGDVYELDLSVPDRTGCYTVLVSNPITPMWEYDYYLRHRRGFASSELEAIWKRISQYPD